MNQKNFTKLMTVYERHLVASFLTDPVLRMLAPEGVTKSVHEAMIFASKNTTSVIQAIADFKRDYPGYKVPSYKIADLRTSTAMKGAMKELGLRPTQASLSKYINAPENKEQP